MNRRSIFAKGFEQATNIVGTDFDEDIKVLCVPGFGVKTNRNPADDQILNPEVIEYRQ